MKIAIIGAAGKSGSLIMKEALERGHEVTAFVRSPEKITTNDVNVLKKDIFDITSDDIKDFDVVVNAFNPPKGGEHQHVDAGKVLIEALKSAPNTRLIVVGGAGSLFVDPEKTTRLYDTPEFPSAVLPTATNMGKNLIELQGTTGIKWTHLSPAIFFDPQGKKTGKYVEGKDNIIVNSQGKSYISYGDYAIALVDEIENAKYVNHRFTVVGEEG